MTHLDLGPDLQRLGDALRASTAADLAREEHAARPAPSGRAHMLRRPRMLAGSSLGLAGIGAGLVLALGGSTAPPAFAVTRSSDGVLVHLNYTTPTERTIEQLNATLASMGIREGVTIYMGSGAASAAGPVTCTQGPGATTPVRVLVGANGTETIAPGQSAGNTAEGSFHLDRCVATAGGGSGNTGNSGG
jgi:hypothetical protein